MIDWNVTDGHTELLLALSFGNALMLFFGLATAIPLLIHLWSRNRYAEQRFAAMEFLMRAAKQHAKRIAIENWFLLFLRTAILVLFVLTIADPLWQPSPSVATGGVTRGSRLWIVVLDHSYSMGVQQSGQTRLQLAQLQLEQLLQAAPEGDAFTLIGMGRETDVVIGEPVFDRREVARYAEGIRLSPGRARLGEALERIEQVLDSARGWSDAFDSYRVLFLSDMGNVTWNAVQQESIRNRIRRLAQQASLAAVDVGTDVATQYAITQVSRDASWALPGQAITLDVQLQAYGMTDAETSRLSMFVDGQPVADRQVAWNRERKVTESFTTAFNAPGEYVITFQLGNDALPFDNEVQYVVRIRPQIRALLVGSQAGDTLALAAALKLEGRLSESVNCQEILDHEWSSIAIEEFDLVALSNVTRIRRDVGRELNEFVNRGGCLIIGLGPNVDAGSYNGRLGGEDGVLPAKLTDTVFDGNTRLVLGSSHPVVRLFEGTPNSGLDRVPIWRYQTVESYRDEANRVQPVINFATGEPALLEKQQGEGTCFLFTSSFRLTSNGVRGGDDQVWSPLPVWPTFLPLVHEMVTNGLRHQDRIQNLRVGDDLEYAMINASNPLSATASINAPTVTFPSGRRESLLEVPDQVGRWYWTNLDEVGIYQVEKETRSTLPRDQRAMKFAVEFEAEESQTNRVDGTLLPSQIELTGEVEVESGSTVPKPTRSRPYRWMLMVLLGALLFESWFAMRVGRTADSSHGQISNRLAVIPRRRQRSGSPLAPSVEIGRSDKGTRPSFTSGPGFSKTGRKL